MPETASKVLDLSKDRRCLEYMALLSALSRAKGGIGLTEEEILKDSGLKNEGLGALAYLENEGFVSSFICQEGTVGPYARRYRLVKGVSFQLVATKEQ